MEERLSTMMGKLKYPLVIAKLINAFEPRHDKTPQKMSVRPVWSESSLSAWRKLKSLATQWAHIEDSDQTGSA